MSTHSKVDPSTLGWVKTEIDETLKQARLALESFAENPVDKTRLRFCVTHLHQVVGTLLMVELDGAALLAKETEALAEAILDEKAAADAGACEILTRGIVTLPDYLARLQYGQPDVPLKHLRLINELRAAHNDAPIAELELFSPDLSVRPSSIGSRSKLTDDEYRELAKRLRGTFQPALLDWLRDHTNKSPLRTIAGIFEQLQMQANIGAVEQVFWVAGGLIEAFIDGGLESTAERKKLIARLDQQVKKLVDGSEKATLRSSSESLVRAILWEVGRATSPGPKVTQLKRVFDLDSLLSVDSANDALSGPLPTPEALQSVSAALGKEIEAAQELMSTYFDPEQGGAVSLEPLLVLLRKMSGTLDMLGVPMLKALVDELLLACRALLDKRLANPETASMPMAEALLCLEHSARDIGRSASEWKKQIQEVTHRLRALHAPDHVVPASEGLEVSDAELSESDYKELLNVVGAEVSVNLGRIEEALEGFAADTSRVQLLDEAPQLLSQVLGAMQILGQSHAAGLIEAAQTHIQNIRKGKLIADSTIMDGLAVCVGTIGAYVEGLRAGRHNLETLIDTALQEMNAAIGSGHGTQPDPAMLIEGLRPSLESWLEDPEHQEALDDLQQRLENLVRMARDQGQEKIEKIGTEMSHLLQLVTEDPMQLSPEAIETLKQSFTAMSVLAGRRMALQTPPSASDDASDETETTASLVTQPVRAAPKVRGAPPPPAPPKTAEEEEFDSEIMQIFVEDAREVLENVNNKFIVWRENTDNQNALTELRRGYHTLKGSGRMVGAGDVAELAWAVEDVLNKVREGKLMPSASIVDLLRQTQDALPSMIDTLAGGPMHTVDVEALRATAIALGHPGAPVASQPDPVKAEPTLASSTSTAEPQDDTEPADLPKLDGTLLEIFTTEARGNLANIRQEIAACRQSGGACLVSDVFFRSTHTLQGNARSLGIEAMSETCAEIEKLLHALKSQRFPLGESHLALAGRFADAVSELVDLLNRGATSSSSALRRRFADLASDIRAENTHVAPVESEEMDPAPTSAAVTIDIETEADEEIILIDEVPAPVAATPGMSTETVAAPAPPDEADAVEAIDPELLEIFQEEATDILNSIEEMFTRWRSRPEDQAAVQELKRALHTLKGGARMAGAMTMGNLSHNTETLLRHVEEGAVPIGTDLFDLLDEAHDTLVSLLQQAHNPSGRPAAVVQKINAKLLALVSEESESLEPVAESVPAAPVPPLVETSISMEVKREAEPEPEFESAVEPEPESQPEPELEPERLVAAPAAPITPPPIYPRVAPTPTPMAAELIEETEEVRDGAEPEGKPWLEKMERRGQVRVNTSLLNELVNYAGEVSISRSRMEQQIYSVRDNLSELGRNIVRFRDQIRELEIQSESQILYRMGQEGTESSRRTDFDPLELDRFSRLQQVSRSLAESLHDLGTIQTNLGNFVGEAETVLQHQARINTELQEGLMRTRMVSFATQSARLRHIVRSTARELGKRVELQLEGAEVEVDRNVLERMIGPFEHMVRNSLDHGIESEAERRRAGKPAIGRITIASTQQGSEIIIRFSDDGAGLNIAAIRSKATERGLMPADSNLTEEELIQFILMSGFSTASQITHVSGRGVGMDVVHNEVKQLGGSMSVDTERGVGTTFIIRLPLTLSIAQALMVYVGDQLYAMPLASVVNIIEFPVEKLNSITTGKNPLLTHNDQTYPYMHLGARLGIASQPRNGRKVPVLLARTGTREVAIQIDGLGGTREVVIKTLGPQLSEIKGLAGATILGDGRVILILDVPGLWYRDDVIHFEHRTPSKAAPEVRERPLIMVVDDSLTVRKVTGKHLQKRGMDVMVAKDGIDAVEQLRDRVPDVMLVDIEMPRMDGYELTMRVRSDADLKHIPIIMITSRAGAKHRQKAFELGVDLYMSKPYQEDELFKNVDALLAKGKAR